MPCLTLGLPVHFSAAPGFSRPTDIPKGLSLLGPELSSLFLQQGSKKSLSDKRSRTAAPLIHIGSKGQITLDRHLEDFYLWRTHVGISMYIQTPAASSKQYSYHQGWKAFWPHKFHVSILSETEAEDTMGKELNKGNVGKPSHLSNGLSCGYTALVPTLSEQGYNS